MHNNTIILFAHNAFNGPFLPSFITYCTTEKHTILIYDPFTCLLFDGNNITTPYETNVIKILRKIPLIKKVITYFLKIRFLKEISKDGSIIHIHYCHEKYLSYYTFFKKYKIPLIISIWGSDYYRISEYLRIKQRNLYEYAEAITFANTNTMNDFITFYGPHFKGKCYNIRLGLDSLNTIQRRLLQNNSPIHIKTRLQLPTDKIIVSCGYNANVEQQHVEILEALNELSGEMKKQIHLLFPLTYPSISRNYYSEIKNKAADYGFSFTLFDTYLSNESIAEIRIASDIFINMQTTDQFSASMQEYLFCGTIVMNGSWLPYSDLSTEGIFFINISSFADLSRSLSEIIDNYDTYKVKCAQNKNIIWRVSSWESVTKSWVSLYNRFTGIKY